MWLSIGWLVVLVLLAVLAPVLPFIQDPSKVNVGSIGAGPSAEHWLGADELGRDIFARVIYGAQSSLGVSAVALVIATVIGASLGLLSGYFRGAIETVIMFVCDVVLSFPGLVLVLALVTFLGPGVGNLIAALSLLIIPGIARLTRATVLSIAQRDYVLVARSVGARNGRVLVKEVLPAVVLPLLSLSLIMIGLIIVVSGALDFLGFGVQPPTPTWGGMIASGVNTLARLPLVSLVPATFLFFTILAANTIGDNLRSGLEVRGAVL
jgi:peptide/nickel transport system permease protein